MGDAKLIKRLVDCEDANQLLTEAYKLSLSNDNADPAEVLSKCFKYIVQISDLSYDTKWLKRECVNYNLTWKEMRSLADIVCEYLAKTIKDICIEPIVTEPSHNEGCPVTGSDLVAYTVKPIMIDTYISYNGDTYKIIRYMPEKYYGYYTIYLTTIELVKGKNV